MLSEEWLRMIQADREREIEAARWAHEALAATPRKGRLRTWLDGHVPGRSGAIARAASSRACGD